MIEHRSLYVIGDKTVSGKYLDTEYDRVKGRWPILTLAARIERAARWISTWSENPKKPRTPGARWLTCRTGGNLGCSRDCADMFASILAKRPSPSSRAGWMPCGKRANTRLTHLVQFGLERNQIWCKFYLPYTYIWRNGFRKFLTIAKC